ncbi:MAG: hypothetical protein ABSG64_12585 [Solirubrobacteraceae bacterium]
MSGVLERGAPRTSEKLKGRLAVTILQILPTQASTVDAQKPVTSVCCDPRYGFSWITACVIFHEPHGGASDAPTFNGTRGEHETMCLRPLMACWPA